MERKTLIFYWLFIIGLTVQHIQGQELLLPAAPESVGLDAELIHRRADSIVVNGIRNKAFPGAQVLVAKKGKIIFHKAYGYHTYDSLQPVALTDLYDLASVTKVVGPLPALMKLVEEGKLDLDKPFSTYWKSWRRQADKKNITLRELLAHQGGLEPYIVFLSKVMRNGELKPRFIKKSPQPGFKNQAFRGVYVKNRFNRKMWRIINRSPVSEDKVYRYSGLASLIYPEIISRLTGMSYEAYLEQTFYAPLGCYSLVYNPNSRSLPYETVPTEVDSLYRRALTKDWVHDENASLLGGVSGNAGLFSNSEDLAKIIQMFQNFGEYGGRRYLKEETVKEFARLQYPENDNRRGLGFDKPLLDNRERPLPDAYPAPSASPESFGHSGFTGTFVWADPVEELVFIFLSNRVYPNRDHRKLYELNIRTALQEVFYNSPQ